MTESEIMHILARVAEASEPFAQARVAAALIYKNEILAIGTNKNKTHPFQKRFSPNEDAIFIHAENDAIYNALRKYDTETVAKSKLYISRMKWVNSSKLLFIQGLAKPCAGCSRAIATFNIKHVCYTIEEKGYDYL
jgi:deoxycytidylate deaminase